MHRKTLKVWILLLTVLALPGLIGCNTMKGAGQDIEAAGGKIEKEAKQNKSY